MGRGASIVLVLVYIAARSLHVHSGAVLTLLLARVPFALLCTMTHSHLIRHDCRELGCFSCLCCRIFRAAVGLG